MKPIFRIIIDVECLQDQDELRQLSKRESLQVRIEVAQNTNTPKDVLYSLSKTNDNVIKLNIARNTSAPQDLLESLGDEFINSHSGIIEAVLQNKNTSEDFICKVMNHSTRFDLILSKNDNLSKRVFTKLLNGPNIFPLIYIVHKHIKIVFKNTILLNFMVHNVLSKVK